MARKKRTVGGKGPHKPFASRSQWRLFFANPRLRKYAIGKAHASGGNSAVTKRLHRSPAYRRLPERKVGSSTAHKLARMSVRAGHRS
jgi:hypothetical protein